MAVHQNNLGDTDVEIKYEKFFKTGYGLTPGKIVITDLKEASTIEIEILKFESPWNGRP